VYASIPDPAGSSWQLIVSAVNLPQSDMVFALCASQHLVPAAPVNATFTAAPNARSFGASGPCAAATDLLVGGGFSDPAQTGTLVAFYNDAPPPENTKDPVPIADWAVRVFDAASLQVDQAEAWAVCVTPTQ
jgi:hypothetical protein